MSFFEKYFLRSGFEVTGSLFTVVNLMLIASGYLLFFSVPTLSFPWAPSLLSTASSKNPCWIDSIAFLYLLTPLPEQRLLIQTQFRIIVRTRGTLYLSLYTMI